MSWLLRYWPCLVNFLTLLISRQFWSSPVPHSDLYYPSYLYPALYPVCVSLSDWLVSCASCSVHVPSLSWPQLCWSFSLFFLCWPLCLIACLFLCFCSLLLFWILCWSALCSSCLFFVSVNLVSEVSRSHAFALLPPPVSCFWVLSPPTGPDTDYVLDWWMEFEKQECAPCYVIHNTHTPYTALYAVIMVTLSCPYSVPVFIQAEIWASTP